MPRLRTPQQSYGPRPGVKKGRKFEPCDRFTLTYAIQEQQTQLQSNISGGGCPAISWGGCGARIKAGSLLRQRGQSPLASFVEDSATSIQTVPAPESP